MTKKYFEDAVSPVIGILLMLVVTIIIAAIVSGFAGGLTGGEKKAPQASLIAKEIVINEAYDENQASNDYESTQVAGRCTDIYVLFEHKGGDGISLGDCEIWLSSLQYAHQTSQVGSGYSPNSTELKTGDKDDISSDFSKGWSGYLESYPDGKGIISVGDNFVLHADYARARPGETAIGWAPDGSVDEVYFLSGDYLKYEIIDKKSKKVISTGQIPVPEFSVSDS